MYTLTIDINYNDAPPKFNEGDHPRGQPKNKGEFVSKGSGVSTAPVSGPASISALRANHKYLYQEYLSSGPADRPAALQKMLHAYNKLKAAKQVNAAKPALTKQAPVASTKQVPTKQVPLPSGSPEPNLINSLQKAVPSLVHTKISGDKNNSDVSWVLASNKLAYGTPQTTPGTPDVTGIAVKLFKSERVAAVYEITSNKKGAGGKIVDAMMKSMPDYKFAVHVDLSGGFWDHMKNKYPDRFVE